MARADLDTQSITRAGIDPVYTVAVVDGHAIGNANGDVVVHVKNGDTAAHTITFPTPRQVHGLDIADLSVSVPAGGERLIGPFPPTTFNTTKDLHVDYSAVTSVTIAAFRF